jgi:hypothetical protein
VRLSRLTAAGATGSAVLGAAGLLTAAARFPLSGYVSEAGVSGTPHSVLYRLSIFAIALALGLLAVAARSTVAIAAGSLAAAALFVAVSGTATCSPGCPLPPYERPTAADVVHGASSIVALGWCGLAMLGFAVRASDGWLRRLGWAGVAVAVPLLTLSGAALALAGRGTLSGVLERLALFAACAWLVATATRHTSRQVARPPGLPVKS